jgi:spermidine synthase
MTSATTHESRRPDAVGGFGALSLVIAVLFFVSGAVGLTYQVAWQHIFTTVFGNTTYAVSVVVSVFMAGLALGSYVFGRVADRTGKHLRVFALLQAGIGLTGALVPHVLKAAEGLYRVVYQSTESTASLVTVQVVVSAIVLLVPTFLMGGTLPVLGRYVAGLRRSVAPAVGLLYGLNTLGAAAGAFLTGFVLVKQFGILYTIYLAAGTNLLLAAAFLALHRTTRTAAAEPRGADAGPQEQEPPAGWRVLILLAAVMISGFVSFGYEVLWTRLLALKLETTVYAFSIMLTVFLLGLGFGGALVGLARPADSRSRLWVWYGWMEAGVGLWGLASVLLFFSARQGYASFAVRVLSELGAAALVMLLPTALMGAAFPIVCHLYAAGVQRTGRSIGAIYLFNTAGSVAGALLTGFVLVKVVGTQGSLALVSFLILASGLVLIATAPGLREAAAGTVRRRAATVVGLLAAGFVIWACTPGKYLVRYFVRNQSVAIADPDREVSILGYEEGTEGIVVACQVGKAGAEDGYKTISAGSTDVAGTSYILRNTQKLQAHIPMLIHPDPKRVCQIGFGSGETAGIFTSYPVDRYDCVEISPAMLKVAGKYFADINRDVLRDPDCNIVLIDAAAYLKYTDRKYDIIANDATWPSQAGPAMLFTLEYFRNGRAHLNPGGIMTSWLPLDMPQQDLRSVLRTFHEVFPYVYLWSALNQRNKHALIVGCMQPLQIDLARFRERFDSYAREDLKSVYLGDEDVFLTCHVSQISGDTPDLDTAPLSTEYCPVLKFMYSRSYGLDDMLADAYGLLADHRDSVRNHLVGTEAADDPAALATDLERLDEANDHILAALRMPADRFRARDEELRQAFALAPHHPAALLSEMRRAELAGVTTEELRGMDLDKLQELGRTLLKGGQYDNAIAAFDEWLRREPQSADACTALGTCLVLAHRFADAVGPLERATSLDPQSADAHFNLGITYVRLGRPADALAQFQTTVELAPGAAQAHAHLGTLYYSVAGDGSRALHHLERAVELDPTMPDAQRNLGTLYMRAGQLQQSIAHLTTAAELQPQDPEVQRLLARAYGLSGDERAAQMHLRRAREIEAAAPR